MLFEGNIGSKIWKEYEQPFWRIDNEFCSNSFVTAWIKALVFLSVKPQASYRKLFIYRLSRTLRRNFRVFALLNTGEFHRLGHCRGRWRWPMSALCQLHLSQQWPNLRNIGPIYRILRYLYSKIIELLMQRLGKKLMKTQILVHWIFGPKCPLYTHFQSCELFYEHK